MATTKKAAVKKGVPAKRTAVATKKKPAVKTSAVKHSTASGRTKAAENSVKSFHVSADYPAFNTFKISRQTLYWVILIAFIIFVQLWIIKLQIEVSNLLDEQQASLQQSN